VNATIHPTYDVATITCTTCGTEHVIRSTRGDHAVDVCAECHPFYTGAERPVASGGRIERFQRRQSMQRTAR
jgi:large subunit ribosomal protein L31